MAAAEIILYSHGMIVRTSRSHVYRALVDYCRQLAEWSFEKPGPGQRPRRIMKKIYAAATKDRQEFRFHRNCLNDLIAHLDQQGIPQRTIEWKELPPPVAAPLTITMNTDKTPREDQEGVIQHMVKPQNNKVVDLQTGKGKTHCSLTAMSRIGLRTMIQLRGGFIGQWVRAIEEEFDVSKKDILVIRGRDSLQSLIHAAQEGKLEASVILISWKTLYNFYKVYEQLPQDHIYEIAPEQLFELCQIGLRIVDEVHLDYHFNFRSDIYTNVQSTIQMSATLKTDDPFRRKMYEIALPSADWYKGATYDAYIGTYAVHFHTRRPDKLRTQEYGDKRYSHQAYEKSVMKHAPTTNNYYAIIQHCLDKFYWDEQWERGQKAIVFCSLVKLCHQMAQHFQRVYPNVKVAVYVSETPEKDLQDMDIIFTTVESCGVAVDIPNLRTAILTRALQKREANEQIMGRLRRLKDWPEITPVFLYLVNCDVPKHLEYDQKKREQFDGKVIYHRTENPKIQL